MSHLSEKSFKPARVAVITVSDTRTEATDKSGALIVERLESAGHRIVLKTIVTDDLDLIQNTVKQRLEAGDCEYILLTGGTGLAARDVTPDAVRPLYTKHVPGFGELFRMLSFQEIGAATIQSRADAGLCSHALVVALPGSTGACRLAMDQILIPQLDNRQKPCNFRGIIPECE